MIAVDAVIGFDSLALVFAIGLTVTWGWLIQPAGLPPDAWEHVQRVALRLFAFSVVLLWLTSVAWLWTRTASMSGRPALAALPVVPKVLFHTHFGAVWWLRAAAVGWLSLALIWMIRSGHRMRWARTAVLLFGLAWVAASRSAAGHAAADGDWTLREGMDWLHLVSISVWGGTLIATLLLIFPRLRQVAPGARARFALRFSLIATAALVLVLISGSYNAWHMLPGISAFWSSHYGRLLGIKLLLVAGMVACGAVNHYRLVPALRVATAADGFTIARRLRVSVLTEVALLLGVLGVTALLLGSAPPVA